MAEDEDEGKVDEGRKESNIWLRMKMSER